jgi:small-conductance mechanosensitive channel
MGIADTLAGADALFQRASSWLNVIVIALVIILLGFILGKIVEGILRKLLLHFKVDERLSAAFNARRNYARAIRRTVVRIIYVATVILALRTLSLLEGVWMALLLIVALVALSSFVIAGLDVVPNIAARAVIGRRRLAPGDEITLMDESGSIHGTIMDVSLTYVCVRRRNGDMFFIPNALFLRDRVVRRKQG